MRLRIQLDERGFSILKSKNFLKGLRPEHSECKEKRRLDGI